MMDKQIKDLTEVLAKKCAGQGAAVVIGAALNVIALAAESVPGHTLHAGLADAFRGMADEFDPVAKPALVSVIHRGRK